MAVDKLQDLQDQRNKLGADIKDLASRQDEWNAEDRAKWDDLNAEYDRIDEEREGVQEQLQVAARLEQLRGSEDRKTWQANKEGIKPITEQTKREALVAWCKRKAGMDVDDNLREAAHRCGVSLEADTYNVNLRNEYGSFNAEGFGKEWRAQSTTDAQGGYTIPEGFSGQLESTMVAYGGLRRVARVIRTESGNDIPWPTNNDTGNSGSILAENTQVSEQDTTFGSKLLQAHKYTSDMVRVSQELLSDSFFPLGEELGRMLGERIGRAQAAHFVSGTGSSQPEGIITGGTSGVTAASASAITFDELIDLEASLDPAYAASPNVGWAMNKSTKAAVRKLKDSNGQYLWQIGTTASDPDTLLGKPVVVIQEMDDISTANKPGVIADFSKYIIRDSQGLRMRRLQERFADYDQVAFVGFMRTDALVLQSAAVKYLTMA